MVDQQYEKTIAEPKVVDPPSGKNWESRVVEPRVVEPRVVGQPDEKNVEPKVVQPPYGRTWEQRVVEPRGGDDDGGCAKRDDAWTWARGPTGTWYKKGRDENGKTIRGTSSRAGSSQKAKQNVWATYPRTVDAICHFWQGGGEDDADDTDWLIKVLGKPQYEVMVERRAAGNSKIRQR